MRQIDKEKLLDYLKTKYYYHGQKSGTLFNLIYDIEQGYFDTESGE